MEWLNAHLDAIGAVASIIGTIVGIPALIIALIQLWKTKSAADAAARAARQAVERISDVIAVTSLEQICSRSRDLLTLLRARNLAGSASAAFELRESLAKFSQSKAIEQLEDGEALQHVVRTVAEIHEDLERAAAMSVGTRLMDRAVWAC